jgi:hypothetical protein
MAQPEQKMDPPDILSDIRLASPAMAAWRSALDAMFLTFALEGFNLGEIQDEKGYVEDGHLVVYVDLPKFGRVSMRFPPKAWIWSVDRN